MSKPFAAIAGLGVVPAIAVERARCRRARSGIGLETMEDWLKLKSIAAVGGAWIARTEDIREHRFADIAKRAKAAIRRAAEIRASAK